ncbi:lipoprotein signal peptidase [Candidatus Protofrankia californiensis]|uniref:Lipoprotein signal peptidase n=1 Tax=Candidatus Protofrankia californiensis TaxID=1839754 RepID=A0A1C3P794_9ACTN|nr:lipoprotein signal peptidase [Candidatus Protofrankia californiensis]
MWETSSTGGTGGDVTAGAESGGPVPGLDDPGAPDPDASPAHEGNRINRSRTNRGEPQPVRRSPRAVATLAGAGLAVVTIDVVTKIVAVAHLSNRAPVDLVPGLLDLRLTRNPGAAFSLAGGATVLFSIVALVVVVVIARTARTLKSLPWAVVLGLLLGGALGNLTDRIFRAPAPLRGHVVDWIHLHHWPVFNIADSAIVIGGVLAVILGARGVGLDGQRDDLDGPEGSEGRRGPDGQQAAGAGDRDR